LNPEILSRALNEVVRRHEILRTTFAEVDGKPVQRIALELQLEVAVVDSRKKNGARQERDLEEVIAAQSQRPFDLSRGPLLRLSLVRLHDREHFAVLTFHHIVGDAWSVGVFLRELFVLYVAISTNNSPASLAPPRMQYADFARWQRGQLKEAKLRAQLAHLTKKLSKLPRLELPSDRSRPAVQSGRGSTLSFEFPGELRGALESLGREEGATLFMTVLTAFQLLLSRYVGGDDIVVGTPVAGRNRVELESLIGFFVNMVLVRVSLRGDPTLRELLRRVREECLDAYAHQDVPFERLVEELRPERSLSHEPLVQVVFAHYKDLMVAPEVPGVDLEPVHVDTRTSKFDLSFYTWQAKRDGGLMGSFEYNLDLFDSATVARMIRHFLALLQEMARDPDRHLSELPLLEEGEGRPPRREEDTFAYPTACLHVSFEEQVDRAPDSVALVYEGEHISYGELNRRANRLAHELRSQGVGPETRVGLHVDRSPELVVGILGILKSGGAYVPLDPTYPQERIRFMLEDSTAPVVVTDRAAEWLTGTEVRQIRIDDGSLDAGLGGDANPCHRSTRKNLAYVLYTSGSTGRPKGVAVTHANVARLFKAAEEQFDFDASDTWSLFHSYGFDFSVWEMWGALLYGGRLWIVPHRISRSPEAFYARLREERVTILNQTPSAFAELMRVDKGEHPLPLRYVIFGGEALDSTSLRPWFERHGDEQPRLVNMYGITETTVHVTYRPLSRADVSETGRGRVGYPLSDLQVCVLDRHQRPAPTGVPGEIYVRGAGVARGYLGRPDLTAERFIPDPSGSAPFDRMFRTGDRARLTSDGELQYLGRVDNQVKIRGFRIELGEIESVLREHPAVQQAVAVARAEEGIGKRLVAYLVPNGANGLPSVTELRRHCAARLPDYMVPSMFERLPAMPLTPEGKVDRRALPEPTGTHGKGGQVEPRTSLEAELARIWSEVLKVEKVGIDDNFFDLGGHSFLAVQLASRMRESAGIELPLLRLFENPTIAGLAEALSAGSIEPRPTTRAELLRDAVLDPSITPAGPGAGVLAPADVLLTGSTGFLGAFVLHELLARTQARIRCLVRAGTVEEGRKRIQEVLGSYSLEEDGKSPRIVPVPGDLSRPYFGLSLARFDELASEIDAIYHCGAMVSALYPYSIHRPANVLGTQEVLRLASRARVKPVHYVSTTGVVPWTRDSASRIVREDLDLDQTSLPNDGYSQSKWVAERIVAEACARGLPVSVYRPGRISGHSRTGVSNRNDLFSMILKICIELDRIPQLDSGLLTDLVPVDYVSQALVQLSARADSTGHVFHLVNPHPIEWRDFVALIGEVGYPLEPTPFETWLASWERRLEDSETRLLKSLDLASLTRPDGSWLRVPNFDSRNTLERLEGTSIACADIDAELLNTYFSYWIRSGFLQPPAGVTSRGRR
jgi:amino acid adenylation domain-containing protein/thioester reductase-like protein